MNGCWGGRIPQNGCSCSRPDGAPFQSYGSNLASRMRPCRGSFHALVLYDVAEELDLEILACFARNRPASSQTGIQVAGAGLLAFRKLASCRDFETSPSFHQ